MERIEIEVDEAIAKKWNNRLPGTKQRISEKLGGLLNTILDKEEEDIWPFLEEVRAESEKKGFNDEIMNQILGGK